MPAVRRTSTSSLRLELGSLENRGGSPSKSRRSSEPYASPSSSRFAKKKKSPNAFILFRSHVIENHLLPRGIIHQNDVSRSVAELWKRQDEETRSHFFEKAKEIKEQHNSQDAGAVDSPRPVSRKKTQMIIRCPRMQQSPPQVLTPPPTPESELCDDISSPVSPSSPLRSPCPSLSPSLPSPVEMKMPNLPSIEKNFVLRYPPSPEVEMLSTDFDWCAGDTSSTLSLKRSSESRGWTSVHAMRGTQIKSGFELPDSLLDDFGAISFA